ncbi:acetylpolyamine amidohydrolase [Desulfocurvus sp. DL9XJH121]
MFRIRRIFDDIVPRDRQAVAQVQAILKAQFRDAPAGEYEDIPAKLRDPLSYGFKTILFVAEGRDAVRGFALLLHAPDLSFCYLDYIGSLPGRTSRGIGGSLYERVREEALLLGDMGIFLECPSDDSAICRDASLLRQNAARLKFYERYGARPIVNTAYETPLSPEDDSPPVLVFDGLGIMAAPPLGPTKTIVRAILERKYGKRCPAGYVDGVVRSFRDNPVRIRKPRQTITQAPAPMPGSTPSIFLTVNERHDIHHVHERGYVESPARVGRILEALEPTGLFQRAEAKRHPERAILAVHDEGMVRYFKAATASLKPGKSLYPYVFPIRNQARPPKELPVRAGYYCIDTFTPLNANAFLAAKGAVDCALTSADAILDGQRLAYALVRPPGHHAERKSFGGFCYFNSAAVAAHHLSAHGRIAVLDIDYHHGNGAQDIFYGREDVLTVSIHGHPSFAYPYFSGFADETGEGRGRGCNLNLPLKENVDGEAYAKALEKALKRIRSFGPSVLVVCLGLDTAKGDPTGTWALGQGDFEANGRAIGSLGLPVLVVQEGGYRIRTMGANARRFFLGLRAGAWGLRENGAAANRTA